MARKYRPKKRNAGKRGKIKITQQARIIHKSDKTRVEKPDTSRYPRMQTQVPRSVAPTFKIKIKRKGS